MFDVKKHLIKVQGGRQYLPVSARLVWFREEHPDWGIETKAIVVDTEKQFAIFEATVYDGNSKLMAKGTKMEDFRGFPDYVEKAETGAIGRALAVCGFGTQFAPDLDELDANRFVDSPQPIRQLDNYANGHAPSPPRPPAIGFRPSQPPSSNVGPENVGDRRDAPEPRREYRDERRAEPERNRWTAPTGPAPNGLAADTARPTPAATEPSAVSDHLCTACGRELKVGQEALSLRKYGIALCPVCQKERGAAEAAG